jgi:hypothetical protein
MLGAVGRYRKWWPWIREFDGSRHATGETWRCGIRSPLLIPLRFTIRLDRVDSHAVDASLDGDLTGSAALRLTDTGGATELWFGSVLTPTGGALGALGRFAPRIAERAHDRVIAAGLRQFGRALDNRVPSL